VIRVAVSTAVALWLWQCSGENKTTETTETATANNCSEAVTAFTENIQPHIKADSCGKSGCHSSANDEGKFALKAGTTNAASNRDRLLEELRERDNDASKLWTYLEGHPGNSVPGGLGGLNEEKVNAWVTVEKACE